MKLFGTGSWARVVMTTEGRDCRWKGEERKICGESRLGVGSVADGPRTITAAVEKLLLMPRWVERVGFVSRKHPRIQDG